MFVQRNTNISTLFSDINSADTNASIKTALGCINTSLRGRAAVVLIGMLRVNPFAAEVTFLQCTKMQKINENHLNPVMLVLIG